MGTKVKGLLKGLRYISQVFDENKEKDMQIGFPTDVQHVGHIGWDGQSVDNPSWMNEFKSPGTFQSAPLLPSPGEKENPDIKWVSEDSSNRRPSRDASSSPTKEKPAKPRTSRRHSTTENGSSNEDSVHKEHSTKSRSSRRHHHRKDSSEGHKSSESVGKNNLHIPKISRRKKSKEDGGGSTVRSKGTKESESSPGQESESSGVPKEKQEE